MFSMRPSGTMFSFRYIAIARRVFELSGAAASDVSPQTTADFATGRLVSPRPRHSALTLAKIKAAGFVPRDADEALRAYLAASPAQG